VPYDSSLPTLLPTQHFAHTLSKHVKIQTRMRLISSGSISTPLKAQQMRLKRPALHQLPKSHWHSSPTAADARLWQGRTPHLHLCRHARFGQRADSPLLLLRLPRAGWIRLLRRPRALLGGVGRGLLLLRGRRPRGQRMPGRREAAAATAGGAGADARTYVEDRGKGLQHVPAAALTWNESGGKARQVPGSR
jgi:hypothetical protein